MRALRPGPRCLLLVALLVVALAPLALADELRGRLDRIFGAVTEGQLGAAAVDIATGRMVYEREAARPLTLASNTKLVTTAAALDLLGPEYRFETTLFRRGAVRGGRLEGDLVVRGGGDPCIGARFDGEADGALRRFARAVREAGVRRVSGDIVADDRFFDRELRHPDWPADQLERWYAAPVSALSINDGCVDLTVRPGARPGAPAIIEIAPRCSLVEVEGRCATTANRREHVVDMGRKGPGEHYVVRGAILAGGEPVTASIAMEDPALVFAATLRDRLADEGIAVEGRARLCAADERDADRVPLAVHASLLAEALPVVNKRSQNHVAEELLKTLGAVKGGGAGSFASGVAAETRFLEAIGIAAGTFSLVDGSGLARKDQMAPRDVARLLAHMARHRSASVYLASLAVGGLDGTLAKRLRKPALLGRVLAKTGTIRGVSALSGYVLPPNGDPLSGIAFSIVGNKLRGAADAKAAQDAAVEAIAQDLDVKH